VIAFAVLWFLLWLAPTNSLLPRLDVANDRQLYLALIGPAWALAIGISAWRLHPQWPASAAAALLLVLLAHATLLRNRIYATEISFWRDTAARNPHSARAHNNLGMAYALDCQIDEAAAEFQRSIDLDPQDYRARINLRLLGQGALPGVDMQRCAALAR
jgi:tetratricopeptide (TPR) repeat protein